MKVKYVSTLLNLKILCMKVKYVSSLLNLKLTGVAESKKPIGLSIWIVQSEKVMRKVCPKDYIIWIETHSACEGKTRERLGLLLGSLWTWGDCGWEAAAEETAWVERVGCGHYNEKLSLFLSILFCCCVFYVPIVERSAPNKAQHLHRPLSEGFKSFFYSECAIGLEDRDSVC